MVAFWPDDGAWSEGHLPGLRRRRAGGPAHGAPTAAIAGKALVLRATATDTWSSVASYAWSFGDGTTAPGHVTTPTRPGLYPVTLTVTDAVGNAATRTATTTAVTAPVPRSRKFKLKKKTIAADEKTKLKVRLNTA